MVTRGRPARKPAAARGRSAATTRKTTAAAPTRKVAAKRPAATATKAKPATDVTVYADKEPTGYHKAFARWIVEVVGYDPNEAPSKRSAFLAGVRIATAARPEFQRSEFLEEWREKTGEVKRGPKTADAKRKATREVVSDDEFEDEGDDFEDEENEFDEESEEDTDEFDDEDESDEDEDESEEDEDEDSDDDDDFEDEEEEPEPPKRGRPRASARRTASSKAVRTTARPAAKKGAPASKRSKSTVDPEEDLF